MNNKTIIFCTIFFLIISFGFLSLTEKKASDINNQNIWMLYFDNPQSNLLDFKIENHSTDTSFHWQVATDKTITKEGDVLIPLGETKKIPILIPDSDKLNKKIIISVTNEKKTKEIYKNF